MNTVCKLLISSVIFEYGFRLCHVVRWSDFDGYGFNLHSDKTKNGQFIGKVDENSPSEAAGLKKVLPHESVFTACINVSSR